MNAREREVMDAVANAVRQLRATVEDDLVPIACATADKAIAAYDALIADTRAGEVAEAVAWRWKYFDGYTTPWSTKDFPDAGLIALAEASEINPAKIEYACHQPAQGGQGQQESVEAFGKDCPAGMVQVEFVGCSPKNRNGDYGWLPQESAFLEIYVDGARFHIAVGNFDSGHGKGRGLHIVTSELDLRVDKHSMNAMDVYLASRNPSLESAQSQTPPKEQDRDAADDWDNQVAEGLPSGDTEDEEPDYYDAVMHARMRAAEPASPREIIDKAMQVYEFAATKHGKEGENAIAVDAAAEEVWKAIEALVNAQHHREVTEADVEHAMELYDFSPFDFTKQRTSRAAALRKVLEWYESTRAPQPHSLSPPEFDGSHVGIEDRPDMWPDWVHRVVDRASEEQPHDGTDWHAEFERVAGELTQARAKIALKDETIAKLTAPQPHDWKAAYERAIEECSIAVYSLGDPRTWIKEKAAEYAGLPQPHHGEKP